MSVELDASPITISLALRAYGGCLVGPIAPGVGNLGLYRLDALLFVCPLGHREGRFMSTGKILTAIDDAIRAGNLVRQPQVDAEVEVSHRLGGVGHLTLKIDVPATASVLREAAGLECLPLAERAETEAMIAVGNRVAFKSGYTQALKKSTKRSLPESAT